MCNDSIVFMPPIIKKLKLCGRSKRSILFGIGILTVKRESLIQLGASNRLLKKYFNRLYCMYIHNEQRRRNEFQRFFL
jgi:hypothetical protein